ncbi:MAG: DUF2817 domain-containing protein [Phycisphaerae bacterium]|nr:DUF2817 domain-containing protein [Phycisphaerae bacterium]
MRTNARLPRKPVFMAGLTIPRRTLLLMLTTLATGCAAPKLATPTVVTRPSGPAAPSADEQIITIGQSVQGRPLRLHVFGVAPNPILIFGAIHGDEPTSGTLAADLLHYLRANPSAYAGTSVAILPVANPDGYAKTTRVNAHGVDCNRNFPASNWKTSPRGERHGGPSAASEPETQAIMHAVELLRPRAIISIHSISGGRECNNYDGPGEMLAQVLHQSNGYPPTPTIGYPTPGSFGTWAGIDNNYPTLTLELPANGTAEDAWQRNRAGLLSAIKTDFAAE